MRSGGNGILIRPPKEPVVLIKILEGLKILVNCSGAHMPTLNESEAKNRKLLQFQKTADKRLSGMQKELVFATSVLLLDQSLKQLMNLHWHHLTLERLWITLLILLL